MSGARIRPALIAALVLGLAPGAFACAELEHASPRVGASVASSPREIALDMSEGLDPKGAEIAIDGRAGALSPVSIGKRRMSARVLQPLAPGVHHVQWSVYSKDGHLAAGDYKFEVHKP